MDIITLALAKKYTQESLLGAGALKGEKGDKGERGIQGEKGEKGEPFTFQDFTKEQLSLLKGEPFTFQDFTEEQLSALVGPQGPRGYTGEKGDTGLQGPQGQIGPQGPKGDSYIVSEKDYEAIAKQVKIPPTIIRLNGEQMPQSDLDGSVNLTFNNLNIELGEEITCGRSIGGIQAGTTFSSTTTYADLLRQLLTTSPEEYEGILYYGYSVKEPVSVEGLISQGIVSKQTLLNNGYIFRVTTKNSRAVLAIPKSFGIQCYGIEINGFTIIPNIKETENYFIYYDDISTGNYRYVYRFEEV